MKAMVITAYGSPDVFQLQEVEKPTPKDNQVLIRIRATTVTQGDCELRSFKMMWFIWLPLRLYMGVRKPRKGVLGQELAGDIEAVGKDTKRFKKGDQVFAAAGMGMGTYAEYICLAEAPDGGVMATKPANMTFEEAAAVPVGGLIALNFLRKANIQRGQKVLINGAGGSIGTFAVQLAKSSGADVTVVDSAEKLDMLRSIGADQVIDYTQEDFTKRGESYDVIFDVVGKSSFSGSISSLTENGRYLSANPKPSDLFRGLWTAITSSKKVLFVSSTDEPEDLIYLRTLIEAGTIKSVIDKRYPLEQMADAHRYVEDGHKKGNVVISVVHL